MEPLTLGLVLTTETLAKELKATIADLPLRVLFEVKDVSDWNDFTDRLERLRPDVVIAEFATLEASLEQSVRLIRRTTAAPSVFLAHTEEEPQAILRAMRVGASEYLTPPFAEKLRDGLQRLSAERAPASSAAPQGRAVAFFSAKGGCGATTIACHFVLQLQRSTRKRVLLADCDVDAGAIGFLLKSKSPYSLMDAMTTLHRLDQSYWKALVSNGIPGVEIIRAPEPSASRLQADPDALRHVLRFVRSQYDWIVADLGRSMNATIASALDEMDEAFLVTTPDLPAMHHAQHIVRLLKDTGFGEERLRLVLNRVPKRMELSGKEIERLLGLPVTAAMPDDYAALYDAYAGGSFVPPATALGRHISSLVTKICGAGEESQKQRKFSLLG